MYQNEYRGNLTTDSKETLFSVVPIGACTYRHMSDDDVFHLNINTLEKGLVSREYPVFFATKENCLNFIIQYINSSASFRAFCAEQKKGGTRTRLYYNALCEFKMMVPSKREQEVIASYLLSLDHLITLHQSKCYGRLRHAFLNTTISWEQRKLGDVYSERDERGNVELDILSVSIHHGISQNELDTDELGKSVRRSDDKSLYKHVYYGDLVFNMMRAWQGAIGVVKNEGMVSPAYISAIPDDSVFPEFMDYCLRRKRIINQINNLSYGVTDFRKRLYWEPFTRVTIMMPSVDEQRKITDIFHQLDDLITLHQKQWFILKKLQFSPGSNSPVAA